MKWRCSNHVSINWLLPTFEADDWDEAVLSENGTIWTNNQSDSEIFCRRANENFTTIQDNGKFLSLMNSFVIHNLEIKSRKKPRCKSLSAMKS